MVQKLSNMVLFSPFLVHVVFRFTIFVLMKTKPLTKKHKIDTSRYVNIDTGEPLQAEYPQLKNISTKDPDLVIMEYSEFVTIDSAAREYIEREFNRAECGRILQLCDMTYGFYNILHCKKTRDPHTKETLMGELDYTRNKFSDFLKKLLKKSIIYYITGYKDGQERTWIMLNPTLARKRVTIHRDCLLAFDDLSKRDQHFNHTKQGE